MWRLTSEYGWAAAADRAPMQQTPQTLRSGCPQQLVLLSNLPATVYNRLGHPQRSPDRPFRIPPNTFLTTQYNNPAVRLERRMVPTDPPAHLEERSFVLLCKSFCAFCDVYC